MGDARRVAGWVLAGVCVGLTGVIALWLVTDPSEFVRERLDVNAQALRAPWAWVLAVAVAAGYSTYTVWAVPFVRRRVFEISSLKLLGIWAAVVAGMVEEIVFRALLMDLAATWGLGVVWQVLLSAAVFGVAHATWVLMSGEVRVALPVIASTMVLGGLLAIVYVLAGRNVLPAIVAHTLVNLILEPWLILGAASGYRGNGTSRRAAQRTGTTS